MANPEQVLIIEPQSKLIFRDSINVPVTSYVKLTNPSNKDVMFKIKTTRPKKCIVRPYLGTLASNNSIEIAIRLHPFIFDPTKEDKFKFEVQAVYAPDDDVSLDQIWKDVNAEQLMISTLDCVFDLPVDDNETQEEPIEEILRTSAETNIPNYFQIELQKTVADAEPLTNLESSLRGEILRLKRELMNKCSPKVVQKPNMPMMYIVIAIASAFFGVILGKLIL